MSRPCMHVLGTSNPKPLDTCRTYNVICSTVCSIQNVQIPDTFQQFLEFIDMGSKLSKRSWKGYITIRWIDQ